MTYHQDRMQKLKMDKLWAELQEKWASKLKKYEEAQARIKNLRRSAELKKRRAEKRLRTLYSVVRRAAKKLPLSYGPQIRRLYNIWCKILELKWRDFLIILQQMQRSTPGLIDRWHKISILENSIFYMKNNMSDQSKIIDDQSPERAPEVNEDGTTRRDFVVSTAIGVACVGGAAGLVPFVSSLAPSQEVLAVGTTEVELDKIPVGHTATVMWRGNPVFVTHRTQKEIDEARSVDVSALRDPEEDEARVIKDKWLITIAVCTHLGCVPLPNKGEYDGWFCPCHGSHYDTSARIRKGPAPTNLPVPPYEFVAENKILIG